MTNRLARRAWSLALPVAGVAWALAIVVAPWADVLPDAGGVTARASALVYVAGAFVCHQEPARSFHAGRAQWPVCARCSGLYLSGAAGIVWGWVRQATRRRRVPLASWRWLLVAAASPTAASLALEWIQPGWTSAVARALCAVPLGTAAGVLVAESTSFRGKLIGCERMP